MTDQNFTELSNTRDSILISDRRGNTLIVYLDAIAYVNVEHHDNPPSEYARQNKPGHRGIEIVLRANISGKDQSIFTYGEQADVLREFFKERSIDLRRDGNLPPYPELPPQ